MSCFNLLSKMITITLLLAVMSARGGSLQDFSQDNVNGNNDYAVQASCNGPIHPFHHPFLFPIKKLPILDVLPENGADVVMPDTPIMIYFDTDAPDFYKYRRKLECGEFFVWMNRELQLAAYDPEENAIVVQNDSLDRYTDYHIAVVIFLHRHRHPIIKPFKIACAHFCFSTGSAVGEAVNLNASIVKSPINAVERQGEVLISVTDDYGLPATHARVRVMSRSLVCATDLLLGEDDEGIGSIFIELIEQADEYVDFTIISQDTQFNDPLDTQTWDGTIQYESCRGDLPGNYQGDAEVVANTLNVRYGPSTESPIAYTLNMSEIVTVRSMVGDDWAFIGYDDNRPVYVSACYLRRLESCPGNLPEDYQGEAEVIASVLNVRYGPSTGYPVTYTLDTCPQP